MKAWIALSWMTLLAAGPLVGCSLARDFDREQAKAEVCLIHPYLPACKDSRPNSSSGWKLPTLSK